MDQSLSEFVQELKDSIPLPKLERIAIDRPESALYNIHKRAIPFTNNPLDKVVVLGLTRHEADKETLKFIKREAKRRSEIASDDPQVFFHYDIVPVEALPFERSVFYNEGSPIQ
jgi:hypothetical protein